MKENYPTFKDIEIKINGKSLEEFIAEPRQQLLLKCGGRGGI